MYCPYCSAEIHNDSVYCPSCGRQITKKTESSGQTHVYNSQYDVQQRPRTYQEEAPRIPSSYEPISSWGYVGYQILFSIPIIGFILLVVFALSDENINRRNFARSYFCIFILAIIIGVIFGSAIYGYLSQIFNQ